MAGFDLICCVVDMGNASKVVKYAKKYGAKGGSVTLGKGTVHNRILDFLGITEERKEIVTMITDGDITSDVINGIGKEMHLKKPHHGILFSHPVSEITVSEPTGGYISTTLATKSSEVKNTVYKAIYVIVDRGKGEEVMDAAYEAGARGGTIMNARGAGVHEIQKFFSIEIEPEKEKVLIITKDESKDAIVQSVKNRLEIEKPGRGIIYVLDVAETYGLSEDN